MEKCQNEFLIFPFKYTAFFKWSALHTLMLNSASLLCKTLSLYLSAFPRFLKISFFCNFLLVWPETLTLSSPFFSVNADVTFVSRVPLFAGFLRTHFSGGGETFNSDACSYCTDFSCCVEIQAQIKLLKCISAPSFPLGTSYPWPRIWVITNSLH